MSFTASCDRLGHVRRQQAKPRVGARRRGLDQRDRGDEIRAAAGRRSSCEIAPRALGLRAPQRTGRHFDVTEAVVLFAARIALALGYHARPV